MKVHISKIVNGSTVIQDTIHLNVVSGGAKPDNAFDIFTSTDKYDFKILPNDKIFDLRQKLAIMTDIPYHRQHLYPPPYAVKVYGNTYPIDIKHIEGEYINDIPIDLELYSNRANITVEAYDLIEVPKKEYWLFDANDFIKQKSIIKHKEQIYWGFIIKFFPAITESIYDEYIAGSSLKTYETLNPNPLSYYNRYEGELDILKKIKKARKRKIDVKVYSSKLAFYGDYILSKEGLFNTLEGMDAIVYRKGNTIMSRFTGTIFNVYTPVDGELVIYYTAQKNNYIIKFKKKSFIVHAEWDLIDVSYKYIKKYVINDITPLINEINNMGRPVFQSIQRIYLTNPVLLGLTMRFIWTHGKYYGDVDLSDFIDAGVFERRSIIGSDNKFMSEYYLRKGLHPIYKKKLLENSNDYDMLTDVKLMNKLSNIYRKFSFSSRIGMYIFNLENIRYKEIPYIIGILQLLISNLEEKSFDDVPKLPKLKEYDPVLFNMKDVGGKTLYSKACQKVNQPNVYNEEEIKSFKIKDAIKYRNFTTGEDIYYQCVDSNLHFILNKHPLGYCLPCCGKKDLSSKKKQVEYSSCINTGTGTSTIGKYVIKYGKIITQGRLGDIPVFLEKYIQLLHNNKYYIYGTPGKDIWNSMAVILDLPIDEIKMKCKSRMDEELFIHLYNSILPNFFGSPEEIIEQFDNIHNIIPDANMFYIELLEFTFNMCIILIYDDGHIKLKLTRPFLQDVDTYAILIYNDGFNIIVDTDEKSFFKDLIYEKQFGKTSPIILTIKNFIKTKKSDIFTWRQLKKLVEREGWFFIKKYINRQRLIYAALIETDMGACYFPVDFEPTEDLSTNPHTPDGLDQNILFSVINKANQTLTEENKIRINKVVSYKDKIIAYADKFYYYIDPINADDIMSDTSLKVIELLYSPDDINNEIIKPPNVDLINKIEAAHKEYNVYYDTLLSFINKLDTLKNTKIRKKITRLYMSKEFQTLKDLLGDMYSTVIDDIKTKIFDNIMYSFDSLLDEYATYDRNKLISKISSLVKCDVVVAEFIADEIINPVTRKSLEIIKNTIKITHKKTIVYIKN